MSKRGEYLGDPSPSVARWLLVAPGAVPTGSCGALRSSRAERERRAARERWKGCRKRLGGPGGLSWPDPDGTPDRTSRGRSAPRAPVMELKWGWLRPHAGRLVRAPALREELRGAKAGAKVGWFRPLTHHVKAVIVWNWLFAMRTGWHMGRGRWNPREREFSLPFPKARANEFIPYECEGNSEP